MKGLAILLITSMLMLTMCIQPGQKPSNRDAGKTSTIAAVKVVTSAPRTSSSGAIDRPGQTTQNAYVTTTAPAGCAGCGSGLACGQTRKDPRSGITAVCQCEGQLPDARFEICVRLSGRGCASCVDGTRCSETNRQGKTCECFGGIEGGYAVCAYACTGCPDGTSCGKKDASGSECSCQGRLSPEKYEACRIMCTKCVEGTPCGKSNPKKEYCSCEASGVCTLERAEQKEDGTLE